LKLKIRQYSISIATIDDSDTLLSLSKSLFYSTPYGTHGEFNHKKVRDIIQGVITGDQDENIIICLWKENELIGAIGACIFNPLWNDEKMAAELFFFSKNKNGALHLINAYEDWARSVGCSSLQVGMDHTKKRTFKGFIATEQIYIKRLK
jgi:hypothetical protein